MYGSSGCRSLLVCAAAHGYQPRIGPYVYTVLQSTYGYYRYTARLLLLSPMVVMILGERRTQYTIAPKDYTYACVGL